MENSSRDFMDLSTEIVTNFIQNVILVDDRAKYEISSAKAKNVTKPGRQGRRKEGKGSSESKTQTSENKDNKLDAKEVIDSFAKKGIVCSVIKPDDDDNPWEEIEKVIKRADALILDWEINDTGENATEIIRKIILEDLDNGPRLRLIIVYTQENGLTKISSTIQEDISKELKLQLDSDNRGYALSLNHLRIVIYAKEDVSVGNEDKDRIISYQELPEVMIKEFAKITTGLISNVALESLAVLRRNTPLILGKLGSEMDPPYLTHRAWLPNPDDAMDFAMNIICSEFYSILDHAEVGQKANLEAIEAWLKYKGYGEEVTLHLQNADRKVSFERFVELLKKGVEEVNKDSGDLDRITNKSYKSFTKNFCHNGSYPTEVSPENLDEKASNLNCEFTMLTCLQQQYGGNENKPFLTSGTILKESSTGKHLLCLQPKCDCVRIKGDNRNFFFLELKKIDENKGFDLVLYNTDVILQDVPKSSDNEKQNNYVKFGIDYKIYDSVLLNFKTNYENRVRWTEKDGNQYCFITSDGKKFRWISEIKSVYIQKILNNLAAEISRVGLDEFEWSRRWNGNN